MIFSTHAAHCDNVCVITSGIDRIDAREGRGMSVVADFAPTCLD